VADAIIDKPLPEKVKLLVNVFTYNKQIGGPAFSYCCGVGPQLADHPRVGEVRVSYTHGYPTDRCRNAASLEAKKAGFDFLLMLDNDQAPDLFVGHEPDAKPFLPTAIDFALAHDGPCLVGAPYCAGPPNQDPVVMKTREYCPDMPGGQGKKIDRYTRDEAAVMTGITRVAALPTGCLLIDMRVFDRLAPPWFYYEYADPPYNTKLASTEDVVFTRNGDWVGVPQFCAWNCWAGHDDKGYMVGKPRLCPVDEVPRAVWEAYKAGATPKLIN
jgi:hypothetical protein